jgi:hypothetical protein
VQVITKDETMQSTLIGSTEDPLQQVADDDFFADSSLILTSSSSSFSPSVDLSLSCHYLTSFDHINRQRGYNTYLPSSSHQYELYWRLLYGIDVSSSSSSEYSSAFTLHQIAEMIAFSSAADCSRTVQVISSSGPKIVPQCVFYSGCDLDTPPLPLTHSTPSCLTSLRRH